MIATESSARLGSIFRDRIVLDSQSSFKSFRKAIGENVSILRSDTSRRRAGLHSTTGSSTSRCKLCSSANHVHGQSSLRVRVAATTSQQLVNAFLKAYPSPKVLLNHPQCDNSEIVLPAQRAPSASQAGPSYHKPTHITLSSTRIQSSGAGALQSEYSAFCHWSCS